MRPFSIQAGGGLAWSCLFHTHNDLRLAVNALSGGLLDTIYADGRKSVRGRDSNSVLYPRASISLISFSTTQPIVLYLPFGISCHKPWLIGERTVRLTASGHLGTRDPALGTPYTANAGVRGVPLQGVTNVWLLSPLCKSGGAEKRRET